MKTQSASAAGSLTLPRPATPAGQESAADTAAPAPPRRRTHRPGNGLAWAALAVGVAYALVSVSWGLGSTWALSTVGGTLAREGSAGNRLLLAVVWGSVVLKLVAAALGVLVVAQHRPAGQRPGHRVVARLVVLAAWTAATILTVYGGVLTAVGLLVQVGAIGTGPGADTHALFWHAVVWDPWFGVWGLLLTAALLRTRATDRHRGSAGRRSL